MPKKRYRRKLGETARSHTVIAVLATTLALLSSIFNANAAEFCDSAIAVVVSAQGVVELRRSGSSNWVAATQNTELCLGDMIRVRERSRAALRLSNESMLRLDQKTALTLAGEDQDKTTLLQMFAGALHILTRTPKPFRVKTPFLNAGVEGTEFFIGMDQDGARLVIYEGKVSASNEHGSLVLIDKEAAIVFKDQAPQKTVMVRPMDAVHWALHYPLIIDFPFNAGTPDKPAPLALSASLALYHQGKLPEALAELDSALQSDYSTHFLLYRAGLLLAVGRVDEARMDIGRVLKLAPSNSDAHALGAIISVVQNDKEKALVLANRAVELDVASPPSRLALSYAQQAHFQIEEALDSVKKAAEFDPENAFVWARLAELHMSTGYLDRALKAAKQAINLNPNLAKTQSVLGFVYLVQIDTKAAKAAFARAIEFDQADPMPRLGMGLAKIREGDLEAGRVELEIAVSLDPANSLIRSYLGKAYFEEKRYSFANTQFDLAKERDPNDPTPWLYDGIMRQTQNRPVEALWNIQKSIELNDNRAVYRSRLLLDEDMAARGSSLARIYDNLGFERRAIMETAKSLSLDPSNHSAHRFLSDAYLNTPRHEIARVSELLQAQLLQPINVNPVQPHLAVADLNIITGTGPTVAGFNEFTPLMERNRPQLVASGVFGSNSTLGNETVLSALYGRTSVSVGQFHYHTDGFRPNNDQKHNIYNAFIQYALTPRFNIQAEVRTRKTEHGDLLLDFGRNPEMNRRNLNEDMARVGGRFSLSPKQDFIVSASYRDRGEFQSFDTGPSIRKDVTNDDGYQAEAQYLLREKWLNVIAGGGIYQIDVTKQREVDFSPVGLGGPCPPPFFLPEECHPNLPSFKRERSNGYLYINLNPLKNFTPTLGFSYEQYKEAPDSVRESETRLSFGKLNPKLGLQWNISPALRLRMAWFQTVKSALISQQTLEPTQVAGFNQMFDDVNGTKATRVGAGADLRVTDNVYGGLEATQRDLKVPFLRESQSLNYWQQQHEKFYRAYLYWLPHSHWSVKGEFEFEKFSRGVNVDSGEPTKIETSYAPVSINYYNPSGLFIQFKTGYVRQELERHMSVSNTGVSKFFILDTAVGFRFPRRRGILSLEGKNLLDEEFIFRNLNFQVSETFYNQRFTPSRTLFLRLTLNF